MSTFKIGDRIVVIEEPVDGHFRSPSVTKGKKGIIFKVSYQKTHIKIDFNDGGSHWWILNEEARLEDLRGILGEQPDMEILL